MTSNEYNSTLSIQYLQNKRPFVLYNYYVFEESSFKIPIYRTAQNFDGEILTNLTNFQQFVNIFPIKIFRLVSYLHEMNE